ncbi:MAG: electron transport complex subunit RsxC [Clostridia bacterium]|nr:electron transport complex subunit RsxC [Clostridia bacterium]
MLPKLNGVIVPHRKNTAALAAVKMTAPKSVTIPMNMHIGAPSVPCVKVGDEVKVGQLIAEAGGFVGAPIHASVSGKVTAIGPMLASNGTSMTAITIESDGEMAVSETCVPPEVNDYDSFIAAVRASGAVGLGGAGFPTSVKLDVKDTSRIQEVVLNGAECEPYITSDTRTMIDDADLIKEGVELLKKYLDVKKVIIGIEKNKPEAIAKMQELSDEVFSVKALPSVYPQGGEKVLIYNCVGKIVPEGKLPIDVGVIVMNCTTLAFLAKYMKTGLPLTEKLVTVDGSAVAEPKNVLVPIGTSIEDLIEFCGGYKAEPRKILYGGPMMGIAVPDASAPVIKNTNAIIALDEKDATLPEQTPCIRCGKCIDACPLNLMPVEYARALAVNDFALLEKRKVNLCMECGCCSFVCPARRPLVENNKLAKAALRKYQAEKNGGNK